MKNLKMLSLRKVNELYLTLKPYLPEDTLEILSYAGIVIDRIAASNPRVFIQACVILTETNRKEVMEMGGAKLQELFVEGLELNHFPEYQLFAKEMGL